MIDLRLTIGAPATGEGLGEILATAAEGSATHDPGWAAYLYRAAAGAYDAARSVSIGHGRRARYEDAANCFRARAAECDARRGRA